MLKNDYIMRMVEQFVQALVRIMKLKEEGKTDQAERELEDLAKSTAGFDLSTVQRMEPAALKALIPDAKRRAILARLLKERGELLEESDPDAAQSAFRKAFLIYDDLENAGELPGEGDHPDALQWLVERLTP